MPPVQHSPKKEESSFQIILDKIESSTHEIRSCITIVDTKIDNAMAMIQSLENTCKNLDTRLKTMEASSVQTERRLDVVESSNETVKTELLEVKNSFITINNSIRTEINEQLNRYQRRLNIIIYGVQENAEEGDMLTSLSGIIWPEYALTDWRRLGEKKSNAVRPIQVPLRTVADRNKLIDNCKKLKGLQKFKGISIKKDQTKIQQEEAKKKYILRSNSKAIDAGPETKKRKLTQVKSDFNEIVREQTEDNDAME